MAKAKKKRLARPRRPIQVAVTGALASGKTTVLKALGRQGFEVLSADEIVHEIYRKKNWSVEAIREECLRSPRALIRWEKQIHPLVERELKRRLAAYKKRPVVVEVPLLYEAGLEGLFDQVIFVYATTAERRQRATRRGMKVAQFDFLNARQWPATKKAARADWILYNFDRPVLRKQLKALVPILLSSRTSKSSRA